MSEFRDRNEKEMKTQRGVGGGIMGGLMGVDVEKKEKETKRGIFGEWEGRERGREGRGREERRRGGRGGGVRGVWVWASKKGDLSVRDVDMGGEMLLVRALTNGGGGWAGMPMLPFPPSPFPPTPLQPLPLPLS